MKPFGPCWLWPQGLIGWVARLCRHRQPRDGAGGSGQRWQRQSRGGKRAALQLQKGGGHIAAGCFQGLLGLVRVWAGVALVSRYSSLAAARLVSGRLWQANAAVLMAVSLIVMGLLLWRHRENMRLLAGTESKIASKKK